MILKYKNSVSIKSLESSLINFLLQKPDIENKISGGVRRIRGLVIEIKKDLNQKYIFTVQIGVCQCTFDALTGLREQGSVFGLERYIHTWLERQSVRDEIKAYINNSYSN